MLGVESLCPTQVQLTPAVLMIVLIDSYIPQSISNDTNALRDARDQIKDDDKANIKSFPGSCPVSRMRRVVLAPENVTAPSDLQPEAQQDLLCLCWQICFHKMLFVCCRWSVILGHSCGALRKSSVRRETGRVRDMDYKRQRKKPRQVSSARLLSEGGVFA